MLRLHVVTPLPCPRWDMSQPGSRAVPPQTRKASCSGASSHLFSIPSIKPNEARSPWKAAAGLEVGLHARFPGCDRGYASHARPETMTETLRSSKLPGKVSSWAWDWKVRGKGACGEKGHVNMATRCVWAYRARCWWITKTREDPAANPCKYLFRVVLGHLTAIWTLPNNADRRQRKQRVLRCSRASRFPGLSVSSRTVTSLWPGRWAKQLFLRSAWRPGSELLIVGTF